MHLDDVKSGALAEVGEEFFATVGADELYFFVGDDFVAVTFGKAQCFEEPNEEYDKKIGGDKSSVGGGETGAIDDVMNGDLDGFTVAYLKMQ